MREEGAVIGEQPARARSEIAPWPIPSTLATDKRQCVTTSDFHFIITSLLSLSRAGAPTSRPPPLAMPSTNAERITKKFIGAVEDEWRLYRCDPFVILARSTLTYARSSVTIPKSIP